eukprot:TRINITY_DN8431_c0_g2_i1.p1 TRINITY_DN8431_c0_g2~~TRINITY_DN8431_c0_g2_i1.p1  ORF type:complete len:813 (-),score=143.84 TRINITY_DN8431_c0_g2_i1:712-3150(-)
MAKLFEEVLAGTSPSPTADLLIHFVTQTNHDCGGPGSSPVAHATQLPAPTGAASVNGGGAPPSPTSAANRRSPNSCGVVSGNSPARCSSLERSVSANAWTNQAPMRVHTLVLQTQPMLLQTLLENRYKSSPSELGREQACGRNSAAGSGISSIDTTSDAEGRQQCLDAGSRAEAAAASEDRLEPVESTLPDAPAHPEGATLCGYPSAARPASVDGETSQEASIPVVYIESAPNAGNCSSTAQNSPLQGPIGSSPRERERLSEVAVEDEPEIFLEMIKFVYLNTCHVDQSNVKALMHVADKYGIEDIVRYCLQWMQEHFAVSLFYHFFTFKFKNADFARLLRQSLLYSLRSRRHFAMVTGLEGKDDGVNSKWQTLPVSFVEALLGSDDLPVVSEAEVLHLLAWWAAGALGRLGHERASQASSPRGRGSLRDPSQSPGSSQSPTAGDAAGISATLEALGSDPNYSTPEGRAREDIIRLLRTFRKSDMLVKLADLEPILQIWQLNNLFSSKPPRDDRSALDPGFIIYRGVAGVKVPHATFGELTQPNVTEEPWRGFSSVTMNSRDFLQQHEGFKPSCAPDGGAVTFPRLWVKIRCSSWAHREKRGTKSSNQRHGIGVEVLAPSHETVSSTFSVMPPMNEGQSGRNWSAHSQDDGDMGRNYKLGTSTPPNRAPVMAGPQVPNLTDSEKIDHKVVCAVISGHMRHGIRIGQRERCSIYDIEDLYGQHGEVCLGGTATELEFELQLTVQATNHCGICQCELAVLPSGAPEGHLDPLVQIGFEASAEEQLRFYISSSHFDSNSCYCVSLNWVLRPSFTN